MSRKYYVETWDMDKQDWTPQQGVRKGPYSLWGLKRALRKLQGIGYPCNYRSSDCCGDPSVSVWSPQAIAETVRRYHKAVREAKAVKA